VVFGKLLTAVLRGNRCLHIFLTRVSGIEVNQDNPNTMYILSGEGDAWLSGGFTTKYGYVSFSNGVFKSTDSGSSWTKTRIFSGH
jgi:hypothetical protein